MPQDLGVASLTNFVVPICQSWVSRGLCDFVTVPSQGDHSSASGIDGTFNSHQCSALYHLPRRQIAKEKSDMLLSIPDALADLFRNRTAVMSETLLVQLRLLLNCRTPQTPICALATVSL